MHCDKHHAFSFRRKGTAGVSNESEVERSATNSELHDARFAMRLSLLAGVLMLAGKITAFALTGSSAIFSDAAESVVHVIAVAFAAFSLWLSTQPAAPRFQYGYERITFFSAGFEGAMIVLAAISIILTAIGTWRRGLTLEHLGPGTILIVAAGALNAGLGWYLLRVGRRTQSVILQADGKHVLTDSWTSFGVVAGLLLVMLTGWKPLDPLVALAVAANILWSGGGMVWQSLKGLLDYSDPEVGHRIRTSLDTVCKEQEIEYHGVRFRTTGYRQIIEVHLLFPHAMELGEAHRRATMVEDRVARELETPAEVITHLESMDDHNAIHPIEHYTGKPG